MKCPWPCWLDIPDFYSNEPQWPLKHCLVIPVSSVNHASLFTEEIDWQLERVMHTKMGTKTPPTAVIMCSYIKTLALTKPVVSVCKYISVKGAKHEHSFHKKHYKYYQNSELIPL